MHFIKRVVFLFKSYPTLKGYRYKVSKEGFGDCQEGDCFSFFAEVYRYLKISNGKMIDFGLRNPDNIKMIESYELPDLFQENIEEAGIS